MAFDPTSSFSSPELTKQLSGAKKTTTVTPKTAATKPTPTQTAILYRAAQWGRSGEKITISYNYPTSSNQSISNLLLHSQFINLLYKFR